MFIGPEADRLALRELLDRYSDAVNRSDGDAWAQCWSEGATWRFRGGNVVGREAILATWRTAMDGFDAAWFSAFPGSVRIDGDTAIMTTHTFEYLSPKGGKPRLQSGLYEDRLVRAADGWQFVERSFTPKEMPL